MRSSTLWLLAAVLTAWTWAPAGLAGCPPEGQSVESLKQLKALEFRTSDANDQKQLALGLLDCLADPDPQLRDELAYQALSTWLRADAFDADTLRSMRDTLYGQLDGDDEAGFRKPFAALVLSELARRDRLKPWQSDDDRAAMIDKAATYLEGVTDYRAFDAKDGWRHGVAHGADWIWQLALNPALTREQADRLLAALAAQIVPAPAPAYAAGEPGRLARPVLAIAQHGFYTQKDWDTWMGKLIERIGDPALAWNDSQWLARRHDLMAFLLSLYIDADQSQDANIHFLKPSLVATVKRMP